MPLPLPRSVLRVRRAGVLAPVRRQRQRWSLLLSLGLLAGGALGCRPAAPQRPGTTPPGGQNETLRQQEQLAVRQCRQRRQELLDGLAELRRAEVALAEARLLAPPPLGSPPVWDEAREQRYSQVDQELDRQRYEQELADWQRRRDERQLRIARQRQQQEAAQLRLDRQARALQQRYPGLFSAPTSIEVQPQALERLTRCPSGPA